MFGRILALSIAYSTEQGFSQYDHEVFLGNGLRSIDVPTDPRSIAMGESFAGLEANPYAMFSNPAGLAAISRTSIAFSRRTMDWIADDMKYSSLSAAVPTSFFNIGFLYNRFSSGEAPVTTPANPEGDGTKASLYDHTFAIGVSKKIDKHFGIGLSIKTFNMVVSYSGPNAAVYENVQSKTLPILFDVGFVYTTKFDSKNQTIGHKFSGGASLQNLGTSFKQTQKPSSLSPQNLDITYTIPKYFRLGLSYGFMLYSATPDGLVPLQLLLTGEYRNAFNSHGYDGGNDFWGLGMELRMFEIASVRLGGFNAPFSSIYGHQSKMTERYGFGFNAPLNRLDESIPFSLSFDYAIIPLTQIPFIATKIKTLHLFSIRLQYENDLF